jgi:subtilase family protein
MAAIGGNTSNIKGIVASGSFKPLERKLRFWGIELKLNKIVGKNVVKLFYAVMFLAAAVSLWAGDLDTIGVTVLRQVDPTLQGSGVRVAQPEASLTTNTPPTFEVNPASVGQPASLFTYITSSGTNNYFPNGLGGESSHADSVGANYYGIPSGVATNVSHVDNYNADYFLNSIIWYSLAIPALIVNQSFIADISQELQVNMSYDNYAAANRTLFISGIGNGGGTPVSPPATCYNGIGVGVYGAPSSFGPTDDGRSKPDLVAPGGYTSFSAPYVAGSAAILLQAANRGDGTTTNSSNVRVLKALLLNGAVKPADWTNGVTTPLDARYGAGIVNVFNSWQQMKGGQHSFIESTSNNGGAAHPPGTNANNEPVLVGWDFNSITNTGASPNYQEQVNHYYFNLPANGGNSFTWTTTLVWNRHYGRTNVNDLNLFLYNAGNSNLVTCSTSVVDNVQHIFLPVLPPGRYDLQVQKSTNNAPTVSTYEIYALAFEIFNMRLNVALTNGNAVISWPVSPTGFELDSTTNLNPPVVWTQVTNAVSVNTNINQNVVTLPVGNVNQFFRLQRP